MSNNTQNADIENDACCEELYRIIFETIVTSAAFEIRKSLYPPKQNGESIRKQCEEAMHFFATKDELCKAYIMQCVAKEIKSYEHIIF